MTIRVAVLIGLLGLGLAAMAFRPRSVDLPSSGSDVAMYQRIVTELQEGKPYYTAVGAALRDLDYASREPFNWRTPLLMMTLARLGASSRLVLIMLGAVLCLGTVALTVHERPVVRASTLIAQAGVLATLALPATIYMSEAWAGVLIGLSVMAYLRRWPASAVALGIAALFVRELAAPYCVLCALMALRNRRWAELFGWTAGALVYAVYYSAHLLQVWAHRLPTDLGHPSSWLAWGGLPALTGKIQFQFWLLLAPFPVTALVLILLVAACCNKQAPLPVRITTATYLGFFAGAGKGFDVYWGLLAWPVWSLACGFGLQYLIDAAALPLRQSATVTSHI